MITRKRGANDGSNLLDGMGSPVLLCGDATVLPDCDAASPIRWGLAPRRELGMVEATALAVGFLLASLVFLGLHNALTGEASETQPGQASHWKGPRLLKSSRVQWGGRAVWCAA